LSLIIQCEEFLVQKGLVTRGQFFSNKPHKYAPQFIVAWILNECDELNLDGSRRPSEEVRATYGTAQKMRASMTYAFGRLHGLGTMHWVHNPVEDTVTGNPSVSEMVSRYMLSLRRRKVKAGETATSARAISADKAGKEWGGPRARRLLELAYTIAFICLLQIRPFVVYALPESLAHLCPVRAYAEWLKVSNILKGFIFRKLASGDRISVN
ncbi:hypothetical protein EI94DRAFT_1541505, partial [Lactarius quietus]